MDGYRFPLFIDLHGRKAVVIGGGKIALRRAEILLAFGADVRIIAPECSAVPEGAKYEARPYQSGDLEGAFLAVAATDSRAINHQVGCEASRRGIFVTVSDKREESSFFFPAICMGNGLVSGIVSEGNEHAKTAAAAKKIRGLLEEMQ